MPATVAPAVLGVLTLLFSALRKPVPVIVFSVLAIAMSMLLTWDFENRGVIPSSSYDWGEARWVYLVAGIAAIAFAARAIALRRQVRKT